uniref:Kinetochore protein Nuf2 N-terminal domain-containing protein n=1 Tax=Timema monikensis TaxID=170555 RepID=A0A7R9EGG6_9NEOP|nr:unnamed protein product [Timema monikensis]
MWFGQISGAIPFPEGELATRITCPSQGGRKHYPFLGQQGYRLYLPNYHRGTCKWQPTGGYGPSQDQLLQYGKRYGQNKYSNYANVILQTTGKVHETIGLQEDSNFLRADEPCVGEVSGALLNHGGENTTGGCYQEFLALLRVSDDAALFRTPVVSSMASSDLSYSGKVFERLLLTKWTRNVREASILVYEQFGFWVLRMPDFSLPFEFKFGASSYDLVVVLSQQHPEGLQPVALAKTMANKLKTEQELLSAIQEKIPDFQICLSDLKNPSREFVFRYYTMVLGEFGADVNSMVLPHPAQKNKFPHISPETLRLTNIFKLLKVFFARIGEEFSLEDLTDPHPKRTLYLISHLDNFHTFADMRAASINEVKRNVFDRMAKRDQTMSMKDNIEEKINQECIAKVNRQTTKLQLESQIEMFEDNLEQLMKKKSEIVHVMDSLKSMESTLMEQNEKLSEKENELERRIEMMKLQIVPSPQTLQENLTQLKAQLQVSVDEVAASKEAQQGKFQLLKKLQLCMEQQSARDNLLSSIINLHHEQRNTGYTARNTDYTARNTCYSMRNACDTVMEHLYCEEHLLYYEEHLFYREEHLYCEEHLLYCEEHLLYCDGTPVEAREQEYVTCPLALHTIGGLKSLEPGVTSYSTMSVSL